MLEPLKMKHGRSRTQRRPGSGFSLVELMIVIAVAALIIGLAAPSFSEYIVTQRVRSVHAQLVTDLQYARSEAAARGRFVGVQFQYRAGSGDSAGSCYLIFARSTLPTANPKACECFEPEGSRCTNSETLELRRVHIPNSLRVTVRVPASIEAAETGPWKPVAYFDPTNGSYQKGSSPAPAALDAGFEVTTRADDARALRVVAMPVGRLALCTPSGSTLGGSSC